MYTLYHTKSEYNVFDGKTQAQIAEGVALRSKAFFKDIVSIITSQEFDGSPLNLSTLCDMEVAEFVQDNNVFKSFLKPLTENTDYPAYPTATTQQPFEENMFAAGEILVPNGIMPTYWCAAYLEFEASDNDTDNTPAYLFLATMCGISEAPATPYTPAYRVYASLCKDTSEYTSANLLDQHNTFQKRAVKKLSTDRDFVLGAPAMPMMGGGHYDLLSMSLIISMSATSDGGGHLLLYPKLTIPATTVDENKDEYTQYYYNRNSSAFYMTRYQPIDHWYDTNNAKVTPMLPWAVMTTVPNGLTSGSPVCGQTLNLFNTGTQLINEASAAYNDLCHVKWVASSATPALDSFYNNLISDRTRTTAINLIGLNITPVSLTTVMLGKVSSISGIYYVGGQGLTYGDVISAVNANNSFVNYIVLPAKDVFIGPVDTTNEDVTLKLAVPLA